MAKEHSRFGGSVAARVLGCPGSVALCATVPNRSSVAADEGSAAHALAELCLKEHLPAAHFLGEMFGEPAFEATQDMVDAVKTYLGAITEELALTPEAEFYVEKHVQFPTGLEKVFGTIDAVVWHPSTGRLRVFDYKHGSGVVVSPEESAQLLFYAASLYRPEIKEVVLTIVQPRPFEVVSGFVPAVKDWSVKPDRLKHFIVSYCQAIYDAQKPDAPLAAGAHCTFCPASLICPAKDKEAVESMDLACASVADVSVDILPDPKTLDVERLSKIVSGLEILNAWAGQCQAQLEGLLMGGLEVPGWKVVEKVGRRKYVTAD